MAVGADGRALNLTGVPDGLLARAVREYRIDEQTGERVAVRTRRGLRKLDRVELVPAGEPRPLAIDSSEQRWLLGAGRRRWSSVRQRYGAGAWARAVELVAAGVVRVRCEVDDDLRLTEPLDWVLTEDWNRRRAGAEQLRAEERERWGHRAAAAADAVRAESPALADALGRTAPGSGVAQVLVYAAEDLTEGVVSAGPRGFSQAHFGDSKAHDDVATVLRDAGVNEEILLRLGVRRSARLGVTGPIEAEVAGARIDLSALDGPVLLRADQRALQLRLVDRAPLVIVENLQAAETLADQQPSAAIVYTAGLLSPAALRLIGVLAVEADSVLLVPDADLGGVRIAGQVLRVAPAAQLIDIGELPHPPSHPWSVDSVSIGGLKAAAAGPAGALARACLERGYPVEQELATVDAVRAQLGRPPPAR